MGKDEKIVVEHYPVDRLPVDLRRGLSSGQSVRVTVETETELKSAIAPLASFIGVGQGIYSDPEAAVRSIRQLRDEWE